MTSPGYTAVMERTAELYKPLAMALLHRIRVICEDEDLTVHDPFDFSDDCYRWSMMVHRHEGDHAYEDGVDITIEISEEREYDNPEGWGLNFGIDITEYGGRVLGRIAPYNFTPEVWADSRDADAVAARWQLIENAFYDDLPDLIIEGYDWDTDGYYKDVRHEKR